MYAPRPARVDVAGDPPGRDHGATTVADDALRVPRVPFPPRWRTVLLAESPRDVSRRGMSLYAATRPAPLAAQHVLWALSGVLGTRVVPGSATLWEPPMGREVFGRLWSAWSDAAGAPIDGFAAYQRAQVERSGVALLLCAGDRTMFVRAHTDPAPLARERQASEAAAEVARDAFRVPTVLAHGETDGWSWQAYEPLSTRPHRPLHPTPDDLRHITAGARAVVEATVERPADVPSHWQGAHGDLTPWNLRRAGAVRWLIDWEDACWAPPGADEVYFSVVRAALSRRPRRVGVAPGHEEARDHWRRVVLARRAERIEGSLRSQMLVALGVDPAAS